MKIFFILLLTANIIFGLIQWLLPYSQLKPNAGAKIIPVAEQLQLLNEFDNSTPLTEIKVIEDVKTNANLNENAAILAIEDSSDNRLCFTTGPFKDKVKALEVSGRYSSNNIRSELKSSLEKEYLGVMVYITGHKDRNDVLKTAEALAAEGISEYMIINEPGKENVLSLGVFGLKKNAERRTNQLKELNYSAKTEARYRKRTIYWLYHQQSNESDIKPLLSKEDRANGISQMPRQCT